MAWCGSTRRSRGMSGMIGIPASVVDGVVAGPVYGLAAISLTLIAGAMNVIDPCSGAAIPTKF